MTLFTWISSTCCGAYVVRKVARWWTTRRHGLNDRECHGDGVHCQESSRSTQRDKREADGGSTVMWTNQKIRTTSGTDNTGADDMKEMRQMMARFEDRLDCYSNEIITLKTENFKLKSTKAYSDRKLNDKMNALHGIIKTLSDRVTNLVDNYELLNHRMDAFENQSAKVSDVSNLHERIDTILTLCSLSLSNLVSGIVSGFDLFKNKMAALKNESATVSDVSELHKKIDTITESGLTKLNNLESGIINEFSRFEDQMADIQNQSAKASDVTEIHERIDLIHTASATTFNNVVTDILNRFDESAKDVSKLHENVDTITKSCLTNLSNLESDIINAFNKIVDQIADVENQAAKASDVTEIHERLDMIHTSSAMTFSMVVTDMINRFDVFEDKMSVLESKSVTVSDVSELEQRIIMISKTCSTTLNNLKSVILNELGCFEDQIADIQNQSAKAWDVTKIHERIDMIYTLSAMTFNNAVTHIINRFGLFEDQMANAKSSLEKWSESYELRLNDLLVRMHIVPGVTFSSNSSDVIGGVIPKEQSAVALTNVSHCERNVCPLDWAKMSDASITAIDDCSRIVLGCSRNWPEEFSTILKQMVKVNIRAAHPVCWPTYLAESNNDNDHVDRPFRLFDAVTNKPAGSENDQRFSLRLLEMWNAYQAVWQSTSANVEQTVPSSLRSI